MRNTRLSRTFSKLTDKTKIPSFGVVLQQLFYTVFMVIGDYIILLFSLTMIPIMVSMAGGILGVTYESQLLDILLLGMTGLFITLWVFVLSYLLIRKLTLFCISKIKATVSVVSVEHKKDLNKKDLNKEDLTQMGKAVKVSKK